MIVLNSFKSISFSSMLDDYINVFITAIAIGMDCQ